MGAEQWVEEQENIILFENPGAGGNDASHLLSISPTNRVIADGGQAQLLMTLRITAIRFRALYPENLSKYKWIDDIADQIEQHQLTLEGESRFDFARVAIAQALGRLIQRGKRDLEGLIKGFNS